MTENEPTTEKSEPAQPKYDAPIPQAEPKPVGWRYDVPPSKVDMGVDDAGTAIKKLHSDIAADPNHPYLNREHPLHNDFVEYATALHEAKNADGKNVYDKILADAEAQKEIEQADRYEDAKLDMKKLSELGYEETDVPSDISEGTARCLKMQRLNSEAGEENIRLMTTMMSDDIRDFREPPEIQSLFESFKIASAHLDKNLRRDLAERIIYYLRDAHKAAEAAGIFISRQRKDPTRFGG